MDIQEQLELKREERKKLLDEATKLLEADDIEGAKEKRDEVKKIDNEIAELEKQLEEQNKQQEQVDIKENQKEEVESRMEKRDIERFETPGSVTPEEVRAFENYLETRDIAGGNLTTESGFVVIPEEVITDILKLKNQEFNLDQFVTVKDVKNNSGKYPVVRQSQVAALPQVEELAANPELAVKPFFLLAYDIKTHRGYFKISRESIEDSKVDVLNELKEWMAKTIAATRNAGIVNVLKNGGPGEDGENTQIPSQTATSVDDIKNAINLNIMPNYEHNVAIMSQSAWATIDNLKDSDGRYLVQEDIKESSAKRLLGAKVVVLPDEMLGADGANTLVIGNLKDAIVLFNRSQYQAGWTDYMHFGECLMVAVRQDVRLLDHKAAMVLNLDLGATTDTTTETTPQA
ncbi:phage major capsid protein [Abyssicoccus albus]|uniref:phage major capsid protein n=1 Tax=Abyssicoccus albus TaxID=1817405 RepID=UPI00097E3917|nr:phage major capsid protein [Abyssicoccus albus]AQL56419.1 capsid protein [Abyssicoccus albus]